MVLYQDELIRLELASAQGILYVEPRERRAFSAADVRKVFMSTVACTREHAIQRLLLDFSRNALELTGEEYKAVMAQLAVGLLPTHIRRVARVATADPAREHKVEAAYGEIQRAVSLPLEFRSFAGRAQALAWLMR